MTKTQEQQLVDECYNTIERICKSKDAGKEPTDE